MVHISVILGYQPVLTEAEGSVPIATRPPEFLANSVRHSAASSLKIAGSFLSSGFSTVGSRPSSIRPKVLIPNAFPRFPLTHFFPTLAHPSRKFNDSRTYATSRVEGGQPDHCSQMDWSCDMPLIHLGRWPLQGISSTGHWSLATGHLCCQFVGCATAPRCGTLVFPHRLHANPL